MGFVVLRFDFSGVGDSEARKDTVPFATSGISETQEAMDCLGARRNVSGYVLCGVCSGALVSLRTAASDPRVVGAISVNLAGHRTRGGLNWGRTLVRHYRRLAFASSFRSKVWLQLLSGRIDYRNLLRGGQSFLQQFIGPRKGVAAAKENPLLGTLRKLTGEGIRVFLIHSEGDEGLDYMELVLGSNLRRWIAEGKVEFRVIPGANHTFTLLRNQRDFMEAVQQWAQEILAKSSLATDLVIPRKTRLDRKHPASAAASGVVL
jgi:pimeloyl-ACP methyl ester carboxylesterase